MEDDRFKSFFKDPRCRDIPKNVRKVKIDKRFKTMLKNPQFEGNTRIDERGRVINFSTTEKLKNLYNLKSSSEEDDSSSENEKEDFEEKGSLPLNTKQNEKSNEAKFINASENQKSKSENRKSKECANLADKKLSDASEEDSSDSDDSDDSDSTDDLFADHEEFDHNWEEWHEEAPNTNQIYKRLAVCNMDWDRIRADDLFTVFNSFKPANGIINSVKIYPSEFGLKRMAAEKLKGPSELVEETLDLEVEEVMDKKQAKFHREKLREYQLKRLQYYYAVVDCDSSETADHLYEELNGKEFESSSVRFDLRFIPDDTTFDQEPTSEAYKVPDPSEYKPRYFVSTALGQAKVDLTWDETDPQRQEVLQRAFTEPDNIEKDIKDYLASSSGESEEEQTEEQADKKLKFNDRITKYKELLQSLEGKEKDEEEKYDMEISWQPDLKEKTEKIVKQKLEETGNPFDEMLKKKKEERKSKKQSKSNVNKDEEDFNSEFEDETDASSDEKPTKKENKLNELYLISDSKKALHQTQEKSKKKKKKNKQQKNETIGTQNFEFVQDERFSAIYTSSEFNLDPSDPHFKKTEGNLAIIQEKQRRLKNKTLPPDGSRKNKKAKYY